MQASNITVNTVISGSSGADTIENYAGGVQIYAGAGNDFVYNSISTTYTINNNYGYVTIDGGAGEDSIAAYDPYLSVNGGAGNDIIDASMYSDLTIRGGAGNDSIQAYGYRKTFEYASGDGNDIIYGYNATDTIRITDGSAYSTMHSGTDMLVSIGAGSITLKDGVSTALKIVGGVNRSSVSTDTGNYTSDTTLVGTAAADTLDNYAYNVTIDARAGDDIINNYLGDYVSISAGAGNDSICNASRNWYNTVNGGAGNDTINVEGTHMLIQYSSGDGNDVVLGYVVSDTINITDGSAYQTLTSGNDVIISIGSGSITLKEPYVTTPVIVGGSNKTPTVDSGVISNSTTYTLISGTANADTIYNTGAHVTIDAGAGNDRIRTTAWYVSINGGAGNDFIDVDEGLATVRGGAGNDTIALDGEQNVILYAAGDGNDYVEDYDANDTIRIIDSSEYQTLISGENVIVSIGSGSITLEDYSSTINIRGGTRITPTVEPVDTTPADTTPADTSSTVVSSVVYVSANSPTLNNNRADITIVGSARADSIKNNAADVTIRGGTGNDTIELDGNRQVFLYAAGDGNDLIDDYEASDTIRITDGSEYSTVRSGDDVIISIGSGSITLDDAIDKMLNILGGTNITPPVAIGAISNEASNTLLTGTSVADLIYNSGTNVTIRGGAGNDTIELDGRQQVILYSAGDGNDRIKDYEASDTIRITDGSEYSTMHSGNDIIVSIGSGSITLEDYSSVVNIVNNIIDVDATAPTLNNSRADVTIVGSSSADSIVNSGARVSIQGGDSDDTLSTSGANTTLTGGNGSDRFAIAPSGSSISAVITDLSTDDTIAIASTNTDRFTYSIGGGALNLTDNSGMINLTFDGVTNFEQVSNVNVVLQTNNGNNRYPMTLGALVAAESDDSSIAGVKLNKAGTTLTLKKPFEGTIRVSDVGDKVQTIKATAVKAAVNILANDLDNKITVGKYGSTIEGAGGDDLIKLGKGIDVVVYADGDGDDTIKSYKAGDKIQIVDGAIDSISIKGSTVKLNVGDGSLTIKSVVKKELTIVDADGVESTYKFTKQNNDLDSARISTNAQLPSDDYWFEDIPIDQSPLSEIVLTEAAVDLSTDFGTEQFNRSMKELTLGSARKHQK